MQHLSNFHFLTPDFPFLQHIVEQAERYLHSDPAACMNKLRIFTEKTTGVLLGEHFLDLPQPDSLDNRIRLLRREGVIGETKIYNCFYYLRKKGNEGSHGERVTVEEATTGLLNAFRIARWLQEVYGERGELPEHEFVVPPDHDPGRALEELQQQHSELERKHAELEARVREQAGRRSEEEKAELKEKAFQASTRIDLTERETRMLIDKQLRDAGWEVDSERLTFASGARPEKTKNRAIAEWPVEGGRADYALFIGEALYGVVEAKKKTRTVLSDMGQSKRYARSVRQLEGEQLLGRWDDYRVPFMFVTNSTPYHFQLETRSGTWFLDGRRPTNHPRPLRNWFSPRDLEALFEKDPEGAIRNLQNDPYQYLRDPRGLNLRPYQLEAIRAVEAAVADPERTRALVAMATGTGKTRTILGLCYRLLKSRRFQRMLFLVDRNILGSQAADAFKDVVVEDLETFAAIYDIKEITDIRPELDTKLHFATVQGMYRRIFDNQDDEAVPTVGTYDCIIVDEAHRGYGLDREMDEEELLYKDQQDYQSKYKMVIEYFDAFRIGMTATPAPHTVSIFGRPAFEYSYRQAVIEGYLVDFEPPYIIRTQLSEEGIRWEKGETVKVYDRITREVTELENIEDEIEIRVEGFNKRVLTEPFNRTVLRELVKHIDPYGPGKTLIFCASDDHATDVVKWLKDAFEEAGVLVDDDAILKITGSIDKPQQATKFFKNERKPVIVTTVDLLTTGVDVPDICNLVFLRRVSSRILYEQMLGRATRRADHIGKEAFCIFDAVGLYQSMEEFSNMKPVVATPNASLKDLVAELDRIAVLEPGARETAMKQQLEQIISKLQRKKRQVTDEQEEQFKLLTGGLTPDEYIERLRQEEPAEAVRLVKNQIRVLDFLDEMKGVPVQQYFSEHEDAHLATDRGFPNYARPEDYIESFRSYILDNRNKIPALEAIFSRPRSLTREALNELRLELSLNGFDLPKLKTAWKEARNEDVAADIIAYIRTMALGSPLEDSKTRIRRAVDKVRALRPWTKVQQSWLNRFEKQLIEESILHKEDLDQGQFLREAGGYRHLNRIFNEELDNVLEIINENLFGESA